MNIILFGPWTGEFSYEVQWWIPECRLIASQYPDNYKIAIGYKGRNILYKDFIDEYISFPENLNQFLTFPDCWSQRISNNPRILNIPPEINNFVSNIESNLIFTDIKKYIPNQSLIERRFDNNPIGIFKTYSESLEGNLISNSILKSFTNNVICINPKKRVRNGIYDHETLNIDTWNFIVKFLIQNNKSVVNMYIKDNPGTYDLSHFERIYPNNFKQIDLNTKNSLDIQISLLKNTKGSIYGSSGAAILPIICNTPMLAFQTKESGWRLGLEWHKKLTNNHEKIIIYDNYDIHSYKNISNIDIENNLIKFINMIDNE